MIYWGRQEPTDPHDIGYLYYWYAYWDDVLDPVAVLEIAVDGHTVERALVVESNSTVHLDEVESLVLVGEDEAKVRVEKMLEERGIS